MLLRIGVPEAFIVQDMEIVQCLCMCLIRTH